MSACSQPMPHLPEPDDLRAVSGFYPTPPSVIDMMLQRLVPIHLDHRVLEPSAGRGDIADCLARFAREIVVVESNPMLAGILRNKGYFPLECRFEDFVAPQGFDRIAMNPPFADGLDITHVQRAFALLNPGGILVALMNDGDAPGDGSPEQRQAFGAWLACTREIAQASLERLDPALFLSSENFRPSLVPMKMVRLTKELRLSPGTDHSARAVL